MENIAIIISVISAFVSICTLAFSFYIYRKHGKRLNSQQEELNTFQILKNKKEQTLAKSAKITGEIVRSDKGKVSFIVRNEGMAVARNIRISMKNNPKGIIYSDIEPISSLGPGKTCSFTINLATPHSTFISFEYIWNDENAENCKFSEDIKIP